MTRPIWRGARRSWCKWLAGSWARWLGLLSCLLLPWSIVAGAAEVSIGMNYSWWKLDPKILTQCRAHSAAPFWGAGILPQYAADGVRTTVQEQLKSMAVAGFTTIRSLVMHRRPPHDALEGPLLSIDGSIAPRDRLNIARFVADIRAAGFRTLEISYGFLEENSPYCRRTAYGDCFDGLRTTENWRFIQEATEAVLSAAGDLQVRFDLQNEGCPSSYMAPTTIKAAGDYFKTISLNFQHGFGSNWLISCADSPRAERVTLLLRQLREAGLQPKYLEVHTYKVDPNPVTELLTAANDEARRIGVSLIIGESRYQNAEQTAIFGNWLKAHPGNKVININEWPLRDPSIGCQMDTAPSYTPGGLLTINKP